MTAPTDYHVAIIERQRWDAIVESFPEHSIFHSLRWLDLLCAEHKLRMLLVGVEQGGRFIAIWPCLSLRKGPLRIVGSPLKGWSTAYLGPLIQRDADVAAVLEAFLSNAPLSRWSYFNCRVFDRDRDIDLEPFGFTRGHREETYVIDLSQDEEAIWTNLKGRCRTSVRKARKLGVEIREERDASFLDDFWSMSCEVFAHYGIQPTFSRSLLEAMYRQFAAAESLYVPSAYLDGKRIATLMLPFNGHTMYWWAGASLDEYRKIPAGNLLHWEAICHARRMGLKSYDLVNVSDRGGGGPFKQSFNGQRIAVATHWEACRSKLIRMLKERYRRHLLRRRQVPTERAAA